MVRLRLLSCGCEKEINSCVCIVDCQMADCCLLHFVVARVKIIMADCSVVVNQMMMIILMFLRRALISGYSSHLIDEDLVF